MRDENLVGLWDTRPYDYGVMESSWLCLRPDGTGWSAWAVAGGEGSVSHLTWSRPGDDEIEIRYTWTAAGSWLPGEPPALVEIDEEWPDDTLLRTRYAVRLDTPPLAEAPMTTLHLTDAVESACQFALSTRNVDHTDPAAHGRR
ncbi:hypothetical protein [Micromonospora sagamiensis]|nr:hypothetical protein [Micromonospora sagamiensis]